MAGEKKAGKYFLLSLSADDTTYTTLACGTSNDFSRTAETQDARCKENGAFGDPIPTTFTAEITADGFMMVDDTTNVWSIEALDDWFKAGTKLYFKYGQEGDGEYQITGRCYITNLVGPTASIEEIASNSITCSVSGEWQYTANPTP
jgi:hypothetical protein